MQVVPSESLTSIAGSIGFPALLGHQLRSPLATIKACLGMALEGFDGEALPPETIPVLRQAEYRTDFIEAAVDDFILLLRLEARIFYYTDIIDIGDLRADTMRELANLRMPLATITACLGMVLEGSYCEQLPPESARVIRQAQHKVDFLRTLVRDLDLFLQLEARTFRYSPIVIAISELSARIMGELTSVASARDVALQMDDEHIGLPGQAKVDLRCLSRAMMELFVHALEASRPCGTICVHLQRVGPKFRWTISADGLLIDNDLHERIFEPFAIGGANGSGLSLSIARSMVRLAGGKVGCSVTAQGGTAFRLELPMAHNARA